MTTTNTIIIIDDDLTYREVFTRSFIRLQYPCFHFAHPEDSLDKIGASEAPYVLLDLKLETDSGLRWIKTIRDINPLSKIILITGYASISTAVEAIKLGADEYFTKPITARGILESLNKNVESSETSINEKPMSVERLEWEHIQKVLADNEGNISAAARALNMHRRTLQRKLSKRPVKT
jgi:two-component system response regulator RegA